MSTKKALKKVATFFSAFFVAGGVDTEKK